MKILIACEESQAVTIEFRKLGFEAYSCDILDCSGGHPEWHIKGDVIEQLNKNWDMMIAFPHAHIWQLVVLLGLNKKEKMVGNKKG